MAVMMNFLRRNLQRRSPANTGLWQRADNEGVKHRVKMSQADKFGGRYYIRVSMSVCYGVDTYFYSVQYKAADGHWMTAPESDTFTDFEKASNLALKRHAEHNARFDAIEENKRKQAEIAEKKKREQAERDRIHAEKEFTLSRPCRRDTTKMELIWRMERDWQPYAWPT